MERKPLSVYLSEKERSRLEDLAKEWDCSLSAAMQRLIKDSRAIPLSSCLITGKEAEIIVGGMKVLREGKV